MLHQAQTIPLDDDLSVTVGFTMCFSAPTAQLVVTKPRTRAIVADLSIPTRQLDMLRAALSGVRDELMRYQTSP